MVMDADLPPYGPEVPPRVPNLLIPPPEGASSTNQNRVQNQFVPPLGLNAEVLRNFAQKQEERERFIFEKAKEEQQKTLHEAEQQVLRLQFALRVEAEGHYAQANDLATAAEIKLAHVEQFASQQIGLAEEYFTSEAAERNALAERANVAIQFANSEANAAQVKLLEAEADRVRYRDTIHAEALAEVQRVKDVATMREVEAQQARQREEQNNVAGFNAYTQEFENQRLADRKLLERTLLDKEQAFQEEKQRLAQEAQIILQQLQFTASLQAEEAKLERQRLIDEAALRATSQDLEMRKMKAKTDELMTMLRDLQNRATPPVQLSPRLKPRMHGSSSDRKASPSNATTVVGVTTTGTRTVTAATHTFTESSKRAPTPPRKPSPGGRMPGGDDPGRGSGDGGNGGNDGRKPPPEYDKGFGKDDDKQRKKKKDDDPPDPPFDGEDGNDDETSSDDEDEGGDGKHKRSDKDLSNAKMLELILKMKSSNKSRTKESEVKLSNVPEPSLFKDWITKTRASLASATGRGDKGLQWVMEAENTEATMESLSRSGNKYLSFDAKLAAECLRITHGDLQRDIKAESDRMAKEGKMLRGRQMLWMIHQWYRIASSAGQLYDLADLTKVTCLRGKSRLTLSSNA
jgi:hypothetical protein